MKAITTWVVIADGARARVMSNSGPGKGLEADENLIFHGDHSSTSQVMADRAGRTFDSVGSGRHAMEPSSDPHAELKAQFVRLVASALDDHAAAFDRLILVAPPQALGLLRKALSPAVAQKVTGELAKDLTHLPNAELPAHLGDMLVV